LHAALGEGELARMTEVCAEIREEVAMREWASTKRRSAQPARRCA
jgi:hypothetical protein